MDTVFISYRREESAGHAGRIYDRLREKFGKDRVFMDVSAIEPGVDFLESIDRAVGSCTALLVVIGRRWLECTDAAGRRRLDDPRDFIRLEVSTALRRNIRVIPVLVQGTTMPEEEALPDDLKLLARRNAIGINDTHWDSDLAQLVETLAGVLSGETCSAAGTKRPAETKAGLPGSKSRRKWFIGSIAGVVVALAGLLTGVESFRAFFFSATMITVPEVTGLPEQKANDKLHGAGLQAKGEPRTSPDGRAGTVIAQIPRAGTKLVKGAEVRLIVAVKPPELALVIVPNVVRQPEERAVQMLIKAGLQPGAKTPRPVKSVPPGTVVQQMVEGDSQARAGSQVKRGTMVNLWVAVQPPSEPPAGGTPPPSQPRKMLVKGGLEIRETYRVDLDTGREARDAGADLWYQDRWLTTQNGATMGHSVKGDYESCCQVKMGGKAYPRHEAAHKFVYLRADQSGPSGHLAVARTGRPYLRRVENQLHPVGVSRDSFILATMHQRQMTLRLFHQIRAANLFPPIPSMAAFRLWPTQVVPFKTWVCYGLKDALIFRQGKLFGACNDYFGA